jgi:hypothetical protein
MSQSIAKSKLESIKNELKHDAEKALDVVKQEVKYTKPYYRTFLFVTGSLFLLNGILLYVGTMCGYETNMFCVDLARFYGFREGRNLHLQRTAGLFTSIVAFLNFSGIWFDKRAEVLFLTLITNTIVITHYLLEAVQFRDIRIEFLFLFSVLLIMNLIWTWWHMAAYRKQNTTFIFKQTGSKSKATPPKNIYQQGLRDNMGAPVEAQEVY